MRKLDPVQQKQVSVDDAFWSPRQKQVRDVVVPYQWEALNDRVPGSQSRQHAEVSNAGWAWQTNFCESRRRLS